MDLILDVISFILCLIIYIKITEDIKKLKEENEKKDKQIQHLWTKIEQLEKKTKNSPE